MNELARIQEVLGDLRAGRTTHVRQQLAEASEPLRTILKELIELSDERRFLDSIVENIPNMIFVKEARNLRFVRFNRAGEELLGYKREELIGCNDYDFFPTEEADFFTKKDREVLAAHEVVDIPDEPIHTRLRGERSLHTQKIPIRDAQGEPLYLLGISEDITERKAALVELQTLQTKLASEQMRTRLLEAQKLEHLRVLAGGVAHDFNNLLTAILGNAEITLPQLKASSNEFTYVERIQTAARAATDLTAQLLAYAGKGRVVTKPLDLSSLVKEMVGAVEVSVSQSASIVVRLADLPLVDADVAQMRQVVLNLITNANEALMDGPGDIVVSTSVLEVDENYIESIDAVGELSPGQYVMLEVSDTGIGMDAETTRRMFDPFFTTKESGHGLGLAATIGIVRGHHGVIRVYSEPGNGTTIKVLLPPAKTATVANTALPELNAQGTILVIDDEHLVTEFATEVLNSAGFKVQVAGSAAEGLAIFRDSAKEINLVLLDLTMPQMCGDAVFREMRAIDPSVCVVLSSGHVESQALQQLSDEGLAAFLQKPYTAGELIVQIQLAISEQIA
jgi:PAS domain S-box-containing protein